MKKIALLILAAGESIRMGRIKQLLPWENTTLLGHAIEEGLRSDVSHVNVILGAHAHEILKNQDTSNVSVYQNSGWKEGLGSSIAYGVQQLLKKSNKPDIIIITLADQPFVDSQHINTLIMKSRKQNKSIVATAYARSIGVPALFHKTHFNSLLELNADKGAKSIIQANPEDVVTTDGSRIIEDLDTYEAYVRALRLSSSIPKT